MTKEELDFVRLGFAILEWRLMYFRPGSVHESWHKHLTIENFLYDQAEDIYKELAESLGEQPTATMPIEVDETRGSTSIALGKLMGKKGKNKPTITQDALIKLLQHYEEVS